MFSRIQFQECPLVAPVAKRLHEQKKGIGFAGIDCGSIPSLKEKVRLCLDDGISGVILCLMLTLKSLFVFSSPTKKMIVP